MIRTKLSGGLVILLSSFSLISNGLASDNQCPLTEPEVAQPPDDPNSDPFPEAPWFINEARTIWAGWDAPKMRVGRNKVMWIRPAGTTLEVTAKRLSKGDGEFSASIPCCYPSGFQASGVSFTQPGCWEISATAGTHKLTFVVDVKE